VTVDSELVAGNCNFFDDGDCAGPVEWRIYPLDPMTSYAMCDFHWRQLGGPDGPLAAANALTADSPDVVERLLAIEAARKAS
jgi:hypothetical protein